MIPDFIFRESLFRKTENIKKYTSKKMQLIKVKNLAIHSHCHYINIQ
jgi:hypothetical protein